MCGGEHTVRMDRAQDVNQTQFSKQFSKQASKPASRQYLTTQPALLLAEFPNLGACWAVVKCKDHKSVTSKHHCEGLQSCLAWTVSTVSLVNKPVLDVILSLPATVASAVLMLACKSIS